MNRLASLLAKTINVTGPVSLSGYMRQCLTHPSLGYYTTRDPLGARGDFVTSPEVSQMFGELVGVWFYSVWQRQQRPASINLVEFGPGRATLLVDTLRSFNKLLKQDKVEQNIVLVEASDVLKTKQHETLCHEALNKDGTFWRSRHKYGGDVVWVDTEKDVLDVVAAQSIPHTNYVIAHEFFDALPIKKFIKTEHGWRELLVDFNPETSKFHLIQAPSETPSSYIPKSYPRYDEQPVGTIVEISQDVFQYTTDITKLITDTGAALVVDYGPSDSIPANSLRGIISHKFVDPFTRQGEVDLSVDVDFQAIANIANESANGLKALGPVDQGDWLLQMGIQQRAQQLYESAGSKEEKRRVVESFNRLVSKDDNSMGKAYKFLAIVPEDTSAFGFER
jgi:SAM-dependent MidA family methyltransferase